MKLPVTDRENGFDTLAFTTVWIVILAALWQVGKLCNWLAS